MDKYKQWFTWLAVAVICFAIYFLAPSNSNIIDYNRSLISQGELWRLFTGNFNHTNIYHLLLNIAAFLTIAALHNQHYSFRRFSFVLFYLSSMVGLFIYLFSSDVTLYVGLSGLLHGLIVIGGYFDIRKGMRSGYVLIIGAAIKVAYEQIFNNTEMVSHLIEARVLTEAHLYGLIAGLIFISIVIVKQKKSE